MKPIERNPDIDLATQEIPAGMTLIEGAHLQMTARANNVPFGTAYMVRVRNTIGMVIRNHDVARFIDALNHKNAHKKGRVA